MLKILTTYTLCLLTVLCSAQDSVFIKVHFLYGSKPQKAYKNVEPKWFGGLLGGHVGIESDTNKILNFIPQGKFHWFAKKRNRHSAYAIHSDNSFYNILGGNPNSVKKAIVYIPVTNSQKLTFDSLSRIYLQQTPYDYALFGMRCGAAAYEILGQLQVLPNYSYTKTYMTIFYPKKLRRRVLKKAKKKGWVVETQQGATTRKWEQD